MSDSPFSLKGRVALVTGASRGIGAAIATALAHAGADVAAHGNTTSPDATCAAIRHCGCRSAALIADIADPASPERLVRETIDTLGALDIVVNNAGILRRKPAIDVSDDEWDDVIQVNLNAVFRMCRAAGRHMIADGRGGKIINIASLLSFQGGVTVPAYTASKSGVAGMTKALANEWAAHNININAIAPGYMRTDLSSALQNDDTRNRQILERIPAGRWGDPADLGGAAVFLASRASDYVNGHILAVDGGWLGR